MSGTEAETQPATPELAQGDDVAELEALSSKKAYRKFLADAKALDVGSLEECRVDVSRLYPTVRQGVENVLAQESGLAQLPQVRVEYLRTLPQLVQGLAFAMLRLHQHQEGTSFGALFERAQRLRRKLLKAADALAEAELLAPEDAEALLLLGREDVIGDCLELAALLRRNEARAAGRSPVTSAELAEAAQVAGKLRELLSSHADSSDPELPSLVEALQVRDRFWSLLRQRHELLWRCGAWLFGREVDERVPPLKARYPMRPQVRTAPRALLAPQAPPAPVAPPSQLALVPRPQPPPPKRERPNPMRVLQQKIRSFVSVTIGRSSR